jgi:hypothetical protein
VGQTGEGSVVPFPQIFEGAAAVLATGLANEATAITKNVMGTRTNARQIRSGL